MTGVNEKAKKNLQTFKCQVKRCVRILRCANNNEIERSEKEHQQTEKDDNDTTMANNSEKKNHRPTRKYTHNQSGERKKNGFGICIYVYMVVTCLCYAGCMSSLHSHADNLRYKFVSNKNNYNGRKQINQWRIRSNNRLASVDDEGIEQPKTPTRYNL